MLKPQSVAKPLLLLATLCLFSACQLDLWAAPTQDSPLVPQSKPQSITSAPIPHSLAYVVDGRELHLQPAGQTESIVRNLCQTEGCRLQRPKWSADGEMLLVVEPGRGGPQALIHIIDQFGEHVGTIDDVNYIAPDGAWSSHGHEIVYLKKTDRFFWQKNDRGEKEYRTVFEVWVATVNDDGPSDKRLIGDVSSGGIGCGGYGPASIGLYRREASLAYGVAIMLDWTPQNILLFQVGCTGTGVERFDMQTGQQLQGYPSSLRYLRMNAQKDAWVGVLSNRTDPEHLQIALGQPDQLAWRVVDTAQPPELLFWSHDPNTFFYTSRTLREHKEPKDENGPPLGFIAYHTTELRQIHLDSKVDRLLYRGDVAGIAAVIDRGSDGLLFTEIENDHRLDEAITQGVFEYEARAKFSPQPRIMHMAPIAGEDTGTVTTWRLNAGQLAAYQP